ncbi:MAG: glycoside hydrolase family 88 protein [Bacteroidales bacterium]
MKKVFALISISLLFSSGIRKEVKKDQFVQENVSFATEQLSNLVATAKDSTLFPRTSKPDGSLQCTRRNDWTEGFFPGALWYLYELNNSEQTKKSALRWTNALEPLKTLKSHHDIGFIMYCSYGNAYRLTGNKAYIDILVESANSLCTRFDEKVGAIKSWDYREAWDGKTKWFYPVIIDNMMNLELLYFASQVTGDNRYRDIATKHAETTALHQIRPDHSCYHVVDYNPKTGEVNDKATCQGFTDNSTWARGQAWGIYGYTMVYRETKDKKFLKIAQQMADYYIKHSNLPEDKVPFWDFHAGVEGYTPEWNYNPSKFKTVPRDASAAAITCSALFELSQYSGRKGKEYRKSAEQMLHSLASDAYRAKLGENNNFILMHSVGSIPHNNEIDVPLVYADYYFLEALTRYKALK